jgi:hypothetical protein
MKLKTVAAFFVLTLVAGLATPSTVLADPREGLAASCMGYEGSDVSPPGSEDGPFSQFGMPGILALIDALFPGLNRGDVLKILAKLHEGSHEYCDEAVGNPPE